ncbi:MAG TPA: carbamoyl-phosphate synthase large subunit, partial [Gaiellaceae bacterium]|nr:carbamoyl-phosphate synthase large subunit [Gaiellaceae bacterium]
DDLRRKAELGLAASPIGQVLVEESLVGWDEFEHEVMRDPNDNVVVVCSIENLDPMGVHTGDSVTVAPQMTLSDEAYQELRDAAIAVIRAVGVETGGSNIQFARDRESGDIRVIEMNPRVSRSSALASKATGYPIAKVAAKLAVGYTLDEIPNDLTGTTPASFEPTLDYVVVKFPRFAFEKFPGADRRLGTQMKSVGETMGIGRSFTEAFLKARRAREVEDAWEPHDLHPWFATELERARETLAGVTDLDQLVADDWLRLKRAGWSDLDIAERCRSTEKVVRAKRRACGVRPVFRRVDSCAGEVEAVSTYYYSTWGEGDEVPPTGDTPRVVILGSGPNRIGQGIEFDYCCVHAARSFRELGFETVMVNCNPETVSTDYDTSDRLYFEPLGLEEVLAVCEREQPVGVVIQFGGQTPLKLARGLEEAGYRILGTPYDAVDLAEDRERFAALCRELRVAVPPWGIAGSAAEAIDVAETIGYPVLVRPSYVLGGRNMTICYDAETVGASAPPGSRVLVDRFVEGALEIDVDALCDGEQTWVAAVMQHVEEAGVHSGDSSCALPPPGMDEVLLAEIGRTVERLAPALGVVGLVNVQLAVQGGRLYVLEANPRASRTVPFASKAIGVNLVDLACRLAAGARLPDLDLSVGSRTPGQVSVKAAVFPFQRFPGSDPVLGPEMRSTGEVMASAADYPTALAKAERAAGRPLPEGGTAFLSVRDSDKDAVATVAAALADLGFRLMATSGTARTLAAAGLAVEHVRKVTEGGEGATVVDLLRRGRCDLVINTPHGSGARTDGYQIRDAALTARIPCITTLSGAAAAVLAIADARGEDVISLQERIDARPRTA